MRLMGDPVMGWRQTLSLPSALGLLRLLRVFAAMMSTVFGGRHCHPQIKFSSSLVEGLIFDLCICCVYVNFENYRDHSFWLEGYNIGDGIWKNYGFREHDSNSGVTVIEDFSVTKSWFDEAKNSNHQVLKPRKLPATLLMKKGLCSPGSKEVFLVTGKFNSKMSSDNVSPQVIFKVNKTMELFHFDFRLGETGSPSKYVVWSRLNKSVNETSAERELPLLDTKEDFNLTISCDEHSANGKWKTVLNFWDPSDDPNGLARDPSSWDLNYYSDKTLDPDLVTEVIITGEWRITFAGVTSPSCLSMTPNGLILPQTGSQCEEESDYLCEHQSCYTKTGLECIFPFQYKGETHPRCISEDVYQPWCATQLDGDKIKAWGLCLKDCDFVPPTPSCLNPPLVPKFGAKDSSNITIVENYVASWFNLSFIEKTEGENGPQTYLISREVRARLHQPWMDYDSSNLFEENLSFTAFSRLDHFNDVYEIVPSGGTLTYTCPLGWVFRGSKNTSVTAECGGWDWIHHFDPDSNCVPVICPEEELPLFPNNSAVGEHNAGLMMAGNSSWNSWRSEVTYTCPQGYVLEIPGSFEEQQDPIIDEEALRSFPVQCGDNAVWTPKLSSESSSMPRCIPINCTEIPFPVRNNDMGQYNWTGVQGVSPMPYATSIRYHCPRRGWGFPSSGETEMFIHCEMDGYWSNLHVIEDCVKLPCPKEPPQPPEGQGTEMVYTTEMVHYRCQNGHMFETGQLPYFSVECLNRKWSPAKLPKCVPRKCSGEQRPQHFKGKIPTHEITINHLMIYLGMDVSWFKSRDRATKLLSGSRNRSISDTIIFSCPSQLLTHDGRSDQVVTCIWHRQTDTMLWWPQAILPCNSKFSGRAVQCGPGNDNQVSFV